MYGEDAENVFYYLTIYNEPYVQPPEPDDLDVDGVLRGLYLYRQGETTEGDERPTVQVLASGTGMQWALAAQKLLADDWNVRADVWSATSWTELRREGMACDAWNLLNPDETPRVPYVTQRLDGTAGPVLAVSDFMRAVQDQIRPWVPGDFVSLGTDGFGRSDTRGALRRYFKVDAPSITVAVLHELARRGEVKPESVREAIDRYQLMSITAAGAGNTGGES